jgi:hypothetical protein
MNALAVHRVEASFIVIGIVRFLHKAPRAFLPMRSFPELENANNVVANNNVLAKTSDIAEATVKVNIEMEQAEEPVAGLRRLVDRQKSA